MSKMAQELTNSTATSVHNFQPYRFIRILIHFYGRTDATFLNTEGETHCILTDLPLFRLSHVSNQVRGRKRVKPGAVLVAYMAMPDT